MHPDGSELTVIWPRDDRCAMVPQWSPDGEWLVFSLAAAPAGEWTFPMTRELWVISRDGDILTPIAKVEYQGPDCVDDTVAFSPDNGHVAYFGAECRPWLARADGSGQPVPLADFPYWWTAMAHPQWGLDPKQPR
jgi:Tol biopolymer transport system component